MRSTSVYKRYHSRPLTSPTVGGSAEVEERNAAAFGDALELAVQAGRKALSYAQLHSLEVDCLITSHTTSWAVPSIDIPLVHQLGLRPDVRRIPMASVGCAGGAAALNHAVEQLALSKVRHVLIVVGECLSAATYNPAHNSREATIYKGLFGDSAAAAVVSKDPTWTGPAVALDGVEQTFSYLLPDSIQRYQGELTQEGLSFQSSNEATRSLTDSLPAIQRWLDGANLDFAVVHPGGPRVLNDAANGLGLDPDPLHGPLRHSWESLKTHGNLGGAAVLDVLAAHFDSPPADGEEGIIMGFGPGFMVEATRCHWKHML